MPFISSCISLLGGDFAAVRHAQRRAHGAERREAASNRRLLRQRAHPPPPPLSVSASRRLNKAVVARGREPARWEVPWLGQ